MIFQGIKNLYRKNLLQAKILNFIHIQSFKTPNPNFLKFVAEGKDILGDKGTLDISSQQYANISPLAEELFRIQGVTRVFLGTDYISIAKRQDTQWGSLKPQIYSVINQFLEKQLPILSAQALLEQDNEINENDTQTISFIKEIIATRIRPTVEQDGGDIKFVSFDQESGVLTLKMMGACSGCPSSTVTLKQGIQKMLTYYVKQIKEVVAQDQ